MMNLESEFNISKANRRRVQDSEIDKEVKHPFKSIEHSVSSKFLQKRKHDLERKALKHK